MSRNDKRQQNTMLYHIKAIFKIAWQNIDMFLEWGGGLLQNVLDKHKHNKMTKYRNKATAYFNSLEK